LVWLTVPASTSIPYFTGNNKLKPGYASFEGKPVLFPDGVYHLRYLKGNRRVWEAVSSDAQFALIAKLKRGKSLEARAAGVSVVGSSERALRSRMSCLRSYGRVNCWPTRGCSRWHRMSLIHRVRNYRETSDIETKLTTLVLQI
jgi:hypothetical protein